MDRNRTADVVAVKPAYSADGTPGFIGPTTEIPAQMFNLLIEEMRGVIVASGQTPSAVDDTQLLKALAGALCVLSGNYAPGASLTTPSGQAVIASEASEACIGSVGRDAIIASLNARIGIDWATGGGYSETPLAPGSGAANLTWVMCAADEGWGWIRDSLRVGGAIGSATAGAGSMGVFEVSQSNGFVRITNGISTAVAIFDLQGNALFLKRLTANELTLSNGTDKATKAIAGGTPAASGSPGDTVVVIEYNAKIAAASQVHWEITDVSGTGAFPVKGWTDISDGQVQFNVKNLGTGAVAGSSIRYVVINPATP